MAFKKFVIGESNDEATARLASFPEGSTYHSLSKLPVRNRHITRCIPMYLPLTEMVVVPFDQQAGETTRWWTCAIIASNNPRYPVGGYDIVVSHDELQRAIPVNIDLDELVKTSEAVLEGIK